MANNLTGEYDAVLLIRVLKINGLLATLHQNGADEDASPTFLHSVTVRVGDPPRITRPDLGRYAAWFNALLPTLDQSRGGSENGASIFSEKAPPGASRVLHEAYEDLQAARMDVISPLTVTVRGTARFQLSTPSISLPSGTASEVTVHVHVRAHYTPDPGTIALPEPIHGEVRATYSVTVKPLQNYGSAKNILEIEVPQDDSKIQFHPAAGINLSPFEFAQLLAQIRRVLREGIEPVNVELPADFRFLQFKELGGGQVLALPTQLTDGEPPAGGLDTVTNNFLDADFSIAISREYVETQLQPTIDRFSQIKQDLPVRIRIPFDGTVTVTTYHVSVTSVVLEWKDGSIDVIIKARATAAFAPDFNNITIRQGLTLVLDSTTQTVALLAPDDVLTISGLPGFLASRVRPAIITERNVALDPPPPQDPTEPPQVSAEEMINAQLEDAKTRLNEALKRFDDATSAQYTRLDVTPDGLILHGSIFGQYRLPPVVDFEQTSDGSAFTALKSWIPGGRIGGFVSFEWSWLRQIGPHPTPWSLETVISTEQHRFIFPRPPEVSDAGGICLRFYGIQVDQNGFAIPLAAGETCSVSTPEVVWQTPAWLETMTTPVWLPDTPLDGILEEAIAGHVNVLAHSRPTRDPGTNSLVHFADPRMDKPLDALGQALARSRRSNAPLLVIVVLASGTFGGRRREVEAQLGSLGESFRGQLLLTEDYTGGWRRTFDTERAPSTYLINARGEFVFEQEGVLDTEALAAALDEHFTSGRAPRFRRLSLTVSPGARAPRTLFTDDRGQRLALHQLRDPVLLNFWQSWSAPSIRELQRLQSVQEKSGEGAPVIVAVSGDKDCEVLAEIRRKYNLTFALVHDSGGFIARRYGVECWPTTVSIDPDGLVDGVQFGIARAQRIDARPE